MENHLKLSIIVLVMLEAVFITSATFVQNIYKKTEPGRNITGKVGAEIRVQSEIECIRKCAGAKNCKTYQYEGSRPGNCLLIQPNCSIIDGPMFEQEKDDVIFEKVNVVDSSKWTEPMCWTGPEAALYYSFDAAHGLVLMQGSQELNQIPLVTGKAKNALSLNRTRHQWIDLGIHTEACIIQPETCGAAGGAISLWLNSVEFRVDLPHGHFWVKHTKLSGWFHIVLNYIGPDGGQGIRIYYDGEEVMSDTTISTISHSAGDGRIVMGRLYTDQDTNYPSVQVDELIFFNTALSKHDIELLYNTY